MMHKRRRDFRFPSTRKRPPRVGLPPEPVPHHENQTDQQRHHHRPEPTPRPLFSRRKIVNHPLAAIRTSRCFLVYQSTAGRAVNRPIFVIIIQIDLLRQIVVVIELVDPFRHGSPNLENVVSTLNEATPTSCVVFFNHLTGGNAKSQLLQSHR